MVIRRAAPIGARFSVGGLWGIFNAVSLETVALLRFAEDATTLKPLAVRDAAMPTRGPLAGG